ncbi:RNA-binding CRS1 / YhbY (CRM) domain protein isoform X2 [Tasmannia lanceolata]|uniref:RNA-binding CRS1 / YhbY (CRM) domain protein isoform X2 n=1 Tax=Tasmannia lanceolata TaxID=3420 RepID=UPI0040648F48
MVARVYASMALCKSLHLKNIRFSPFSSMYMLHKSFSHPISSSDVFCKVFNQKPVFGSHCEIGNFCVAGRLWIYSYQFRNMAHEAGEPMKSCQDGESVGVNGSVKVKRKKLKGKRAVVRWLKHFRYKKKKEYERMTVEEKILYRLRKARNKEARLLEALKKIEPPESSETTHDPEILTPEEHFYFLKMGHKCKNYVPIGRRGIFQGVILNMHLHWKKHQTLKVIVKTFSPEEVREIAAELARLSGGIVLDIHEENTIIMYRGKNYSQPPTEIMSPKITLSKRKALDKSKIRDGLRALRILIPRLERDLEVLQVQAKEEKEHKTIPTSEKHQAATATDNYREIFNRRLENLDAFKEITSENDDISEDDSFSESSLVSDSEALSDIFETDSDGETGEKADRPLYLDAIEKFPTEAEREPEDFKEHLRQIAANSNKTNLFGKNDELSDLDEVDRMFLRAGSLLRKKRK